MVTGDFTLIGIDELWIEKVSSIILWFLNSPQHQPQLNLLIKKVIGCNLVRPSLVSISESHVDIETSKGEFTIIQGDRRSTQQSHSQIRLEIRKNIQKNLDYSTSTCDGASKTCKPIERIYFTVALIQWFQEDLDKFLHKINVRMISATTKIILSKNLHA